MNNNKMGFIFYPSYLEAVEKLPPDRQLAFLKTIFNFAFEGKEPQHLTDVEDMAFNFIKSAILSSRKRYEDKSNKGKKPAAQQSNPAKRGRPPKIANNNKNEDFLIFPPCDKNDKNDKNNGVFLSSDELAEKWGVSKRTIQRYKAKNGDFDPKQARDKKGRFSTVSRCDKNRDKNNFVVGANPHNKAICTDDKNQPPNIKYNKIIDVSPNGEHISSVSGRTPNGAPLTDVSPANAVKPSFAAWLDGKGAQYVGGDNWYIDGNVYDKGYLWAQYEYEYGD